MYLISTLILFMILIIHYNMIIYNNKLIQHDYYKIILCQYFENNIYNNKYNNMTLQQKNNTYDFLRDYYYYETLFSSPFIRFTNIEQEVYIISRRLVFDETDLFDIYYSICIKKIENN